MHVHGMLASSHRCLPEPTLISVEWYLSSRRQSRCGPKAKKLLPNRISSGMQVRMNIVKGLEIVWAGVVRARLPSWHRGTQVGSRWKPEATRRAREWPTFRCLGTEHRVKEATIG